LEGLLFSLLVASIAFLLGVRLGRRGAAIALRICVLLVVVCGFTTRYILALPDHSLQSVMWVGFMGGVGLMSALVLIGPSVFTRWLHALALSVAVVTLFRAFVSAETLVCFLTGSCLSGGM
jgi:hypothetical protein